MNLSKGFYFTFISAIIWAISIVLLRIILKSGENLYNVFFWVTLIEAPFWLFLFSKKKTETKKLTKNDYYILIGIGIISSAGVTLTEILALTYSTAINYSFLIRTVILFTFIFAYLFLGEKITKKKIILAIILLGGAYLLTTKGQAVSLTRGDFFTLLEAALIALGNNVLGKMATNSMSTSLSASASKLIGFLPSIIIAIYFTQIVFPKTIILICILALLYILLNQFRFNAYKNASASYVTMIFSFTPVFVSFMAIPLLGESMTVVQTIGGILIIMAGILVEKLKV